MKRSKQPEHIYLFGREFLCVRVCLCTLCFVDAVTMEMTKTKKMKMKKQANIRLKNIVRDYRNENTI